MGSAAMGSAAMGSAVMGSAVMSGFGVVTVMDCAASPPPDLEVRLALCILVSSKYRKTAAPVDARHRIVITTKANTSPLDAPVFWGGAIRMGSVTLDLRGEYLGSGFFMGPDSTFTSNSTSGSTPALGSGLGLELLAEPTMGCFSIVASSCSSSGKVDPEVVGRELPRGPPGSGGRGRAEGRDAGIFIPLISRVTSSSWKPSSSAGRSGKSLLALANCSRSSGSVVRWAKDATTVASSSSNSISSAAAGTGLGRASSGRFSVSGPRFIRWATSSVLSAKPNPALGPGSGLSGERSTSSSHTINGRVDTAWPFSCWSICIASTASPAESKRLAGSLMRRRVRMGLS